MSFDRHGQLAEVTANLDQNESPLYSKQIMNRRSDGKISDVRENVTGATAVRHYRYDASGRLEDVFIDNVLSAHYSYDLDGNRTSRETDESIEEGVFDSAGRVLEYGYFAYTHDAAGTIKTRTHKETGAVDEFNYDARGSLREVRLGGGDIVSYEVDALGRRVGRRLNGDVTARWLYRNGLSPIAQLDGSNHIVATFIYAERVHVPALMKRAGVTYRLITDDLGSVRFVVDLDTGSIAQAMSYDEFGRVLSDSNPGFQPFGFAGGLYDADTGLVRFGARDYDAYTGRWTARDPALFRGRSMNLYTYTDNDPVNFIDPSGLCPTKRRPTLWDTMVARWYEIGNFSVSGTVALGAGVTFELEGAPSTGFNFFIGVATGAELEGAFTVGAELGDNPEGVTIKGELAAGFGFGAEAGGGFDLEGNGAEVGAAAGIVFGGGASAAIGYTFNLTPQWTPAGVLEPVF